MIRRMMSTAAVAALTLTAACSGGEAEGNNVSANAQQEAEAPPTAADPNNLNVQAEMQVPEGDPSSDSVRETPAGAPEPAPPPATRPKAVTEPPAARSNPRPPTPRSEPKVEPAAEPPAAATPTQTCTPEHRAAGHC